MRSNNFKTSLKNSSSDQALIAEFWNKIYRKSIKNRKTKNNLLPLQRVEPFHKLRLPSLTKTQIFWLKSNAWRHRTNHTCPTLLRSYLYFFHLSFLLYTIHILWFDSSNRVFPMIKMNTKPAYQFKHLCIYHCHSIQVA